MVLKKLKKACDSSSNILKAYVEYVGAITEAKELYEDLAKEIGLALELPNIKLEDFEIDG